MRDLQFMANVLASSTHDMQNILAIIKESDCLITDILKINGNPKFKHGDKLLKSLEVIIEQVERGRGLMRSLNGFAHAAIDGHCSCDLAAVGRQAVSLANRMVRLKDCTLSITDIKEPLPVASQPFYVIEAIFACIGQIVATCQFKEHITLLFSQNAATAECVVHIQNASFTGTWNEGELEVLMQLAAGRVEHHSTTVSLFFPSAKAL